MTYYAIVGRLCGWDEDAAFLTQSDSLQAAVDAARDYFWGLDGASSEERELAECNGEGVFVNQVLASAAPISDVTCFNTP